MKTKYDFLILLAVTAFLNFNFSLAKEEDKSIYDVSPDLKPCKFI
jgi:hypothetical protein